MKIVWLKLSEIKPYANNPRKNDAAVDAVAKSIKEFGWKQPLLVDVPDSENLHEIIVGDTRYKAAQQLGQDRAPCIIADDLTDEQKRAYRLADNKVGEIAEWDYDLLKIEFDGIGMDMSGFGFASFEASDIDIDNFFESDDNVEKKIKVCPHCGGIL